MDPRSKFKLAHGAALGSVLAVAAIAGGCGPLELGMNPAPSASPSVPNYLVTQAPAPIFYLDAPATVSAGATFSILAWVYMGAGSWGASDTLLPDTFRATLDAASHSIGVCGLVRRLEVNPDAHGVILPMMMVMPWGATVSVVASASAGTYTVAIASPSVLSEAPLNRSDMPPYPSPAATRSLLVE